MKYFSAFRQKMALMALFGLCCASADQALAQAQVTITKKVVAGTDDAEENVPGGSMYITSADLELILDGTQNQVIGVRFTSLPIPQGATINHAFIQFSTKG